MIEFIQRYWLEVFFGCIVSALSLVVRTIWAKIQHETEEQQVMKDAALALRVALHTDGRQFKAFLEA